MAKMNGNSKSEKKTDGNIVVLGIFRSRPQVEACVAQLKAAGYRNADISALFPTGSSNKEFAHEAGTKMPEGATTGVASGVVLGGVLGWLAGIGSLAIPGVGPLIAAGPIMAALAGAGIGGAVGGITGALVGLGFPEYEAKRYEGQVKDGGILLSVHCDNKEWSRRAQEILEASGAQHISSTGEASADYAKSDRPYSQAQNM